MRDVHGCTSVASTGSAGATKRVNPEYHEKNNIPDIINRFKQRDTEGERKRTEQSFLVPMKEIEANDWDLSINRYKEIVYEEVVYDAPSEIIKQIEQLDGERVEALRVLKGLLVC
ncbi:MAG: hypothetical protein JKY80_02475 [Mariprofundaceae bacterium]|nr:hypothetical protein [Mariprofundaceae bacterium]